MSYNVTCQLDDKQLIVVNVGYSLSLKNKKATLKLYTHMEEVIETIKTKHFPIIKLHYDNDHKYEIVFKRCELRRIKTVENSLGHNVTICLYLSAHDWDINKWH